MADTFLDFIKKNANRGDHVGDYCHDTLRILKMYNVGKTPRFKKDFKALFNYNPYACDEAHQAFKDAWAEYKGKKAEPKSSYING